MMLRCGCLSLYAGISEAERGQGGCSVFPSMRNTPYPVCPFLSRACKIRPLSFSAPKTPHGTPRSSRSIQTRLRRDRIPPARTKRPDSTGWLNRNVRSEDAIATAAAILETTIVVRHADCLFRVRRARFASSSMSAAPAVQINGFGLSFSPWLLGRFAWSSRRLFRVGTIVPSRDIAGSSSSYNCMKNQGVQLSTKWFLKCN
jgi:hypothetical protein